MVITRKLKSYIPLHFKYKARYLLSKAPSLGELNDYSKRCFVFLAADYGNLGDIAITEAQVRFLHSRYPDYRIVEVPISVTLPYMKRIKRTIRPDDIITLIGGGNMNTRCWDIELLRQMVIRAFPHNRIISFPQTLYFEADSENPVIKAAAAKRRMAAVYSGHDNLVLLARERPSYDLMKAYLGEHRVELLPDIVMTLDESRPVSERSGVMLCMRHDKARSMTDSLTDNVISAARGTGRGVTCMDTHIGEIQVGRQQRDIVLQGLLSKFRSAEVVITDRLHGMILGFVTATPTIALPCNSHKISGSYKWIADCGYVLQLDSLDMDKITDFIAGAHKLDTRAAFASCSKRIHEIYANLQL
jgi:pyruvyl transferase EpsI